MLRISFSLIAFLMAFTLIGQNIKPSILLEEVKEVLALEVNEPTKIKSNFQKAIGDTLYYEDFANQIPAGWTTQNNAGNSNDWIWANTAPGGQYSANVTAAFSPTAANGFLSMPSDFYNTPTPPGGFVTIDASVSSPAITIQPKPSVDISWNQR